MNQKNTYTTPTSILEECSFFRSVADKEPKLVSCENIVNDICKILKIKENADKSRKNFENKYLYPKS